jgi:AraC-like DNA-binding protein
VIRQLRAAFEKITPQPSASFICRRIEGARFEAPYHYHPELELTCILRSSGHRFVGDSVEPFGSGDLVLLGPNLPHVWLNPPTCRQAQTVFAQFLPDFLGAKFFDLPEFHAVRRLVQRSARGLVFSASTRKKVSAMLETLAELSDTPRLLALLNVLVVLASDRAARPLCSPRYAPSHDASSGEKINAVYRHLAGNFRETIFQADVARRVGLSPAAFSRFFRRATGRGFTETLNDIRLGHACEMLRETDRTVAEICYECGFENLANFNRQFRRRHTLSPREWRRFNVTQPSRL